MVGSMAACLATTGCGGHHILSNDYVYVVAKQASLRDRVAAVSSRTGTVTNGEKLVVLTRARRWLKVRDPRGEVGWLDEKMVATQQVGDAFEQLAKDHADDPAVGQATVRDEVVLHIAPGREKGSFYRLKEDDKLELLARATILKPVTPGAAAATDAPLVAATSKSKVAAPEGPPAPVMEDWWLVRQPGSGHTGWIYGRMIDVDAPPELERYAEGARIVGAYVLAHVNDPDSGAMKDGQTDPNVPEYVTVLAPGKSGLPYDFDQVRVFTWNLKKHRYETAMREKDIEGYLPVTITTMKNAYGKTPLDQAMLPAFRYNVLAADAPTPVPDAKTGIVKPSKTITKTYRLEGTITQRVLPPGLPPPAEAHPVVEEKKDKKKRR
jgi:hypothetical protein